MKAIRTKNRIRAFAVSITVCLAMVVGMIFSFGFGGVNSVSAADGNGERPDEKGIRFVQVAAGKDFAIGLTYDNRLFGWSLIGTTTPDLGSDATLGAYYTSTPTEINVVYRTGPGGGSRHDWTTNNTQYHGKLQSDDKIRAIAATSTTAAFITEAGYIYTWGNDTVKDLGGSAYTSHGIGAATSGVATDYHYLLLRSTNDPTFAKEAKWYEPYIIDYNYYDNGDQTGLYHMVPTSGVSNMTIAAGENNYIVAFQTSQYYNTYVWGSLLYAPILNDGFASGGTGRGRQYIFDNHEGNSYFATKDTKEGLGSRKMYKTQYTGGTVTAVAGGYTVGLNASIPLGKGQTNVTSLTLKGKNFLTSVDPEIDGTTVTPVLTVNANTRDYRFSLSDGANKNATGLSDINFATTYTVKNAIAGGYYSVETTGVNAGITNVAPDNDYDNGTKADLYFARQAVSSSTTATDNITYTVPASSYPESADASGISNAYGTALDGTRIILNAVSLGNDIGYGIDGDGQLYAWGDNTNGQSGNNDTEVEQFGYPQKVLKDLKFKTVAAGKQLTGSKKAFNAGDTLTITSAGDGEDEEAATASTAKFIDEVKNSSKYITGAITRGGDLYVWSDIHPAYERILFNGNANTKFAAVYSGYDRNIFAVTTLGKLVRITCDDDGNFSQIIYDNFSCLNADGGRTAMTNWTVDANNRQNSTNKSSVNFVVPNLTDQDGNPVPNPEIGSITLYIDSVDGENVAIAADNLSTNNTMLNGVKFTEGESHPYSGKKRESLVSTNAAGDAFRILSYKTNEANPQNSDYNIEYAKRTVAGAVEPVQMAKLTEDDLKPKFSFKAKGASGDNAWADMDEEQWKLLFEYDIVGSGSDIGIKITPNRSTLNGTVNVSFYIARFDDIDNPGGANYYDYLQCNFEFTVQNTDVVRVYDAYDADGRSSIPLLDPNNDSNKYYSLASQNVSEGFNKLAAFLTGNDSATASANVEFVDRIKAYLNTSKTGDVAQSRTLTWDPGFPSSEKISAGNLNYYLGSDAGTYWYKDEYKHLFEDRDLDIVRLSTVTASDPGNGGVTQAIKNISVTLTGLASGDNALTNAIDYDEGLQERINKRFENVYGLVGITVAPGEGENASKVDTLTFSYEILLFTAAGSTGNLDYGENPSVSSFKTEDGNRLNTTLTFALTYEEYITANRDFTTKLDNLATNLSDQNRSKSTWGRAISAFAQPTVRLRSSADLLVNDNIVYGAAQSGTGYTANNHVDIIDRTEHRVGDSEITFPLSRFIGTAGSNISFSYGNQNNGFSEFNDQFKDSINGDNYVTLTRNSITVSLLGAHPIYFTVTIQRFFTPRSTEDEPYFVNGDETVTISFVITTVREVEFAEADTSTQKNNTYNISREMYFHVFGIEPVDEDKRADVVNSTSLVTVHDDYRDVMTMTNPTSSNYNVLNVSRVREGASDSNKILLLTPRESGRAVVQFTLSLFGTDIPIKLTFNVSGVTTIKDKDSSNNEINYTVNLADVQYVYMSTLTTGLQNAVGDFIDVANYAPLYNDVVVKDGRNIYEGVDFVLAGEQADNETPNKDKSANEYYARFVKNIAFYETGSIDRAYMRIDINSDATYDQLKGEYIVYVKFVDVKNNNFTTYADAEGSTILRAAFRLKANKQVAFVDGAMLEIVADVDHPKAAKESDSSSDWYMTGENTEAKIYVPLRYLCGMVGIENYNEYEIYLVSAAEGTAKYINPVGGSDATLDVVEITPLYNTKAPITLNVSIRNKTKGMSENQVVAFSISVKGISTVLSKGEYTQIWLVAFFSSLGLLMVIFLIRMIIYWRRRAKQRALIKRNQELIKMRDKVHNKATAATREQALKTKLKLQDPKYAKMFNEMKKDQNGGIGVSTVGEDAVAPDDKKSKKKKKGGKKSMAELKAELAAKRAAFAQAQSGGDPFAGGQPGGFGGPGPEFAPGPDFGAPGADFGGAGPDFGAPGPDMYAPNDIDGNAIIFDAPDVDSQG